MKKKLVDHTLHTGSFYAMTPERVHHARKVFDGFRDEGLSKYSSGQREHGGNLWEKHTLKMMREELIDHMCYLDVAQDQWEECIKIAKKALQDDKPGEWVYAQYTHLQALRKITNILTTGNSRGKK